MITEILNYGLSFSKARGGGGLVHQMTRLNVQTNSFFLRRVDEK